MPDTNPHPLVVLLSEHHDQLYRYIFSLVGQAHDARDVLQETSFALYERFDSFDESRPFLPWAYKFAYIHVLSWRRRKSKEMPTISADVVELLAKERDEKQAELNERLSALEDCLTRLPEEDRRLIGNRYLQGTSPDAMAETLNTSRRTLYRDLKRIRHQLMNCIHHKVGMDGAT
ncbi:sigma-70 family RNA polymerase sigma factor [Neorhodopirellula lusitana]|uniref:sigma-70 family RNA polymerase sigma factor n=1 Tax=Neorhodopirellula lusitana TaxID=445327 RepID=UPI00384E0D3F